MHWRDYITTDDSVLMGKPVIKGTRLSVDFILGLFGQGWNHEQILENYPGLTKDSLNAAMTFAAETMREISFHPLAGTPRQ